MAEEMPIRVLVVDDDASIRSALARALSQAGYEPILAQHAEEGLRVLTGAIPGADVALVDVNLPGMSGLELVRRLRRRPLDAYLPVILITGNDAPADVAAGLDAGADDYVTKPFELETLKARLRNVLRIRRMEDALRESHGALRRDLEAARQLQLAFIPRGPLDLPGARLAWAFAPSHYVAGDMLDVMPLPDGRVALYVADISGHGAGAAMLSIWLNRTLRGLGREEAEAPGPLASPRAACDLVEERFFRSGARRHVALLYGVLDARARQLSYCRCGIPYPIRLDARGVHFVEDSGAPPLGLGLGGGPEIASVDLARGDRLFLFSDGLLEALGELVPGSGEEQLADELLRRRALPLAAQVAEVASIVRDLRTGERADDVTLLGIEVA